MAVIRTAGITLLLTVLLAGPAAAQDAASPSSLSLPGWRFQVRPYLQSSGVSVGVYHRLSDRWDAGVQLSSVFESQDDRQGYGYPRDDVVSVNSRVEDSHEFGLTGLLEFRRWAPLRNGLSAFVGPQILVAHHTGWWLRTNEDLPFHEESYQEIAEYSIGVGPVLGADMRLFSHLSITMSLRPLLVDYGWGTGSESSWAVREPLEPARTSESTSTEDSFSVDTTLLPQAYLTVTF